MATYYPILFNDFSAFLRISVLRCAYIIIKPCLFTFFFTYCWNLTEKFHSYNTSENHSGTYQPLGQVQSNLSSSVFMGGISSDPCIITVIFSKAQFLHTCSTFASVWVLVLTDLLLQIPVILLILEFLYRSCWW